jgi:N-methylhydantoinase B
MPQLQTRPWGLFGGQAGGQGGLIVHRQDTTVPVPDDGVLQPGDTLSVITPGAGGYDDPKTRDRELVRRDLREGKISAQSARQIYGLETE